MKPKLPVIVYLLFVLAVCGLVALGIAAYTAFSQVAGREQALAASILIEAAMVIEGITLIRRNWWAAGGVLVSLIVSCTYNYIQAEQAGKLHGLTNPWQLFTLAIGPLSALFFLALTIGYELKQHENRVKEWEEDQKKRKAQIQEEAKAEQVRRDEKDLEEKRRKEEADRNFELEKERIRQAEATKREAARLEEERKEKIARARIEAKERAKSEGANDVQFAREIAHNRATYEDFAQAMQSNGTHEWTGEAIAQEFGVSRRTGNYWLARWKEEHPDKVISPN